MNCSILFKAPHPNPPRSRGGKRAAFTLAEVLITLAIIGVVAAMTIPSLMTKFQNDRDSAILKEDYSILQQMMLSANDDGASVLLKGSSDMTEMKEWFNTYFLPYIKVNRVCYDKWGCWSKNVKLSSGDLFPRSSGQCGYMTISFILNNGSYVCMDDFPDFRYGVRLEQSTIGFLVDVNGENPPNTVGKDVFGFVFKDNKLLPAGYDMSKQAIEDNCNTSCTSTYLNGFCGIACTVKAQRNHFKLPVLTK